MTKKTLIITAIIFTFFIVGLANTLQKDTAITHYHNYDIQLDIPSNFAIQDDGQPSTFEHGVLSIGRDSRISGLFQVAWGEKDDSVDLYTGLKTTKKIFDRLLGKTEYSEVQELEFNNYDAIKVDFTMDDESYNGSIYAFECDDRIFILSTSQKSHVGNMNQDEYKIMMDSFECESS